MDKQALTALFEKYIKKLRITPAWDIKLEFVEDPTWRKTGDFKIDLLEFGENREFSYGRCEREKSFNDLYEGLKNL